MAAVNSTMQQLGSKAIDFTLPNTSQGMRLSSIDEALGKPVLLMFICNHCPFVIHLAKEMTELANWAASQDVAVFAISANDAQAYPQDGPEKMAEFAQSYGFEFPYLFDSAQDTAKAYAAACTPDFYVYDKQHENHPGSR